MIAVIDAGIVMNTQLLPEIDAHIYVPNRVLSEIKSNLAKNIFDMFAVQHKLTIIDPDDSSRKQVRQEARNLGQTNLSEADIDVLALALMLREEQVVLYSDDFGVRNVAHALQIKSTGMTTTGGGEQRRYYFTCRGCGKKFVSKPEDCDVCGGVRFQRERGF